MTMFRQPRYAWSEPWRAHVRLAVSSIQFGWLRLLRTSALLAFVLILAAIGPLALKGAPVRFGSSLIVVFVVSTGFFLVLLAGLSLLPKSVRIYEDKLVLEDLHRSSSWRLSAISYCELTREALTGRRYAVLHLYGKNHSRLATVLWDPLRNPSELLEVLQAAQIGLEHRL